MKTRSLLIGILGGAIALQAQTVTIKSAGGWFETAHVEWTSSGTIDSFHVYATGGSATNQKLDNPLIRSYGSYWRADALGLAAGSYTLKVVPVVAGVEKTAATTSALTVSAFDRTGFAFANGHNPSAYKADGTPMDSAVIVYLTQKTKNTVSVSVITSSKGTKTTFTGIQNVLYGIKKGYDSRPFIIRMVGNVTDADTMEGGDLVIENDNLATSHITLEGVGNDATANGWGVRLISATNVEVRNLGVMNVNSTAGDDIGLQQSCYYIWIHNNDHFYGDAGSDADQVKGDGAMDVKKSSYITIDHDHFWDNGKSSLLGLSENTDTGLFITYHHNWFDHSDSRHPRVRFYSAHIYNNYYDGNAKYGAGSTDSSSLFLEANYFRNCKHPMMISLQGSDVWSDSAKARDLDLGTFSNEVGGMIKAYNNAMVGSYRFAPYGNTTYPNPTVEFDAYVVAKSKDTVPTTVKSYSGAHIYNNFDVRSTMYSYVADSPSVLVAKVKSTAGRLGGGDFQWTFVDSVDDTSHLVNAPLKAAITNYATSLAFIQGEGTAPNPTTGIQSQTILVNPIRIDLQNRLITVSQGVTMRSAELYSVDGSRVLESVGTTGISFAGLKSGIYLARIRTDRGTFEKMLLNHN